MIENISNIIYTTAWELVWILIDTKYIDPYPCQIKTLKQAIFWYDWNKHCSSGTKLSAEKQICDRILKNVVVTMNKFL